MNLNQLAWLAKSEGISCNDPTDKENLIKLIELNRKVCRSTESPMERWEIPETFTYLVDMGKQASVEQLKKNMIDNKLTVVGRGTKENLLATYARAVDHLESIGIHTPPDMIDLDKFIYSGKPCTKHAKSQLDKFAKKLKLVRTGSTRALCQRLLVHRLKKLEETIGEQEEISMSSTMMSEESGEPIQIISEPESPGVPVAPLSTAESPESVKEVEIVSSESEEEGGTPTPSAESSSLSASALSTINSIADSANLLTDAIIASVDVDEAVDLMDTSAPMTAALMDIRDSTNTALTEAIEESDNPIEVNRLATEVKAIDTATTAAIDAVVEATSIAVDKVAELSTVTDDDVFAKAIEEFNTRLETLKSEMESATALDDMQSVIEGMLDFLRTIMVKKADVSLESDAASAERKTVLDERVKQLNVLIDTVRDMKKLAQEKLTSTYSKTFADFNNDMLVLGKNIESVKVDIANAANYKDYEAIGNQIIEFATKVNQIYRDIPPEISERTHTAKLLVKDRSLDLIRVSKLFDRSIGNFIAYISDDRNLDDIGARLSELEKQKKLSTDDDSPEAKALHVKLASSHYVEQMRINRKNVSDTIADTITEDILPQLAVIPPTPGPETPTPTAESYVTPSDVSSEPAAKRAKSVLKSILKPARVAPAAPAPAAPAPQMPVLKVPSAVLVELAEAMRQLKKQGAELSAAVKESNTYSIPSLTANMNKQQLAVRRLMEIAKTRAAPAPPARPSIEKLVKDMESIKEKLSEALDDEDSETIKKLSGKLTNAVNAVREARKTTTVVQISKTTGQPGYSGPELLWSKKGGYAPEIAGEIRERDIKLGKRPAAAAAMPSVARPSAARPSAVLPSATVTAASPSRPSTSRTTPSPRAVTFGERTRVVSPPKSPGPPSYAPSSESEESETEGTPTRIATMPATYASPPSIMSSTSPKEVITPVVLSRRLEYESTPVAEPPTRPVSAPIDIAELEGRLTEISKPFVSDSDEMRKMSTSIFTAFGLF